MEAAQKAKKEKEAADAAAAAAAPPPPIPTPTISASIADPPAPPSSADKASTSATSNAASEPMKAEGVGEVEYATMHGDDVHRDTPDNDGTRISSASSVTSKVGKLSNRDRRRLAKEEDGRDREKEYQVSENSFPPLLQNVVISTTLDDDFSFTCL